MISFSIKKHRPVKVDNEIVYRSAGARRIQSKCGVSRSERFKQVSEGWEGKGECGVKGGHWPAAAAAAMSRVGKLISLR